MQSAQTRDGTGLEVKQKTNCGSGARVAMPPAIKLFLFFFLLTNHAMSVKTN
jgi:hypothetical protein